MALVGGESVAQANHAFRTGQVQCALEKDDLSDMGAMARRRGRD